MRNLLRISFFILLLIGCKKDEQPPTITLKTGSSYTSTDVVLPPGTQITVGVDAYKTTDELKLFYTEVAYDGSNTAYLVARAYTGPTEKEHYSTDVSITLRNQTGTERWIFNVNDANGRITKKELRITVQ